MKEDKSRSDMLEESLDLIEKIEASDSDDCNNGFRLIPAYSDARVPKADTWEDKPLSQRQLK